MKAMQMVLLIRHRPISVSTIHKTQPNNLLLQITSRQLSSMHSISSIPLTISLTCKYILIVHYSCSLFFSIRCGFTEKSSNFQTSNFGKGGKGNDRITVSVQDKAGMDNSDFATPPDGQSGHMRMFLWDYTNVRPPPPSPLLPPNVLQPGRDGALENSVIVYENTHGITNRMTRGGTGRCLQTPYSTSS